MSPTGRRLAIVFIGLAIALAAGPLKIAGDYLSFILVGIGIYSIAVLALTLLAGTSGIWSMGHAAFMAIGAYMTVNLPRYGVPLEMIVLVSLVTAGIVGYVLGLCAGRFSILYFGLLTLAIGLAAFELVWHLNHFTGGSEGIAVPPVRSLFYSKPLGTNEGPVLTTVLATLVYLACDLIASSSVGRRWLAVKSQRTASMAVGLIPHHENALAFAVSAALTTISGICMAISIGFLDPNSFNLHSGILLIVAAVVGGVGSLLGAVLGAAFIVGTPELARGVQNISSFAFGLATIAVLLFLRKGIVPSLASLPRRWSSRASKRADDHDNVAKADAQAGQESFRSMLGELGTRASPQLDVEGLDVQFGGVKALQDVAVQVVPGRVVGLIGPNGAGKTTLLNVLSGYVLPHGVRRLRLGEVDLTQLKPYQRIRHGLGRTFQHAELFGELRLREMLIVVANAAKKNRAKSGLPAVSAAVLADRILAGIGLKHLGDAYPGELPFGVQKVADIGRVLASGASMIALDEPFSGLDKDEASELRAILRGLKGAGVSILIIDHAVNEIFGLADEVVVFDFGRVLAHGTPEEVAANSAVRAAYFGSLGSDAKEVAHA